LLAEQMERDVRNQDIRAPFVLGAFICIGLVLLGYFIAGSVTKIKALSRTVEVKGLSEREVPANIAIWPIKFREGDNDLNNLFSTIQRNNTVIIEFLKRQGFKENEIFTASPSVLDKQAQEYAAADKSKYRYSGSSTVSVYTENMDLVRATMQKLVELGKMGIAVSGETYESKTQFLFTKLKDIKPGMIEEATKNAREVAEKFAQDSKSKLGKIKRASQGQFSIENRDINTPYIKKVRVVSTVEYYLTD
jgi:uncharacterized protein